MASIALDIQQMLDLALQYSKDTTPVMKYRAETARSLARTLASTLDGIASSSGLAELDLRVDADGQVGNVGAFPWVRVYSKRYAPSAQSGIYLVSGQSE